VENVRLRCSGHNQFEAERTFGAGFMSEKREAARSAAAERVQAAAAAAEARARAAVAEARSRAVQEHARDVMACLRELGFGAGETRRAAEYSQTLPDATLEERVRAALKFLAPKTRFHGRVETRLEART
jgi:membrane protein involved in colicin uptake